MRRRSAWVVAVVLAIGGAFLALRSRPTTAPRTDARAPDVAGSGGPDMTRAAQVASDPVQPVKSSAAPLVARRFEPPDGGVGPEVPEPREGLLTPERQALLASGKGPMLRRIDDNVRALERAVESAERAGDVASADAFRARIERFRLRKQELLLRPSPPAPAPAPE